MAIKIPFPPFDDNTDCKNKIGQKTSKYRQKFVYKLSDIFSIKTKSLFLRNIIIWGFNEICRV
jgi:hypothetical protein